MRTLQALEKGSGAKKEEDCVLAWMMSDAGREMGIEFLDRVMLERGKSTHCISEDQSINPVRICKPNEGQGR